MDSRTDQLLHLLRDAQGHHVNEIETMLRIPREEIPAVVAKFPESIRSGVEVEDDIWKISTPVVWFDESSLPYASHDPNSYVLHSEVTSTNDVMMEEIRSGAQGVEKRIHVAHLQTKGRGTQGRRWEGEPGRSLMFTMCWKESRLDYDGSSLTLVIALSLAKVLRRLGVDLKVKWPNDLMVGDGKIGGILVERLNKDDLSYYVIGVGVNCHPVRNAPQGSVAISDFVPEFDGDELFHELVGEIKKDLHWYFTEGFAHFQLQYLFCFRELGRMIKLIRQDKVFLEGLSIGVDQKGLLLVVDDAGKLHRISSGEVTLRHDKTHEDGSLMGHGVFEGLSSEGLDAPKADSATSGGHDTVSGPRDAANAGGPRGGQDGHHGGGATPLPRSSEWDEKSEKLRKELPKMASGEEADSRDSDGLDSSSRFAAMGEPAEDPDYDPELGSGLKGSWLKDSRDGMLASRFDPAMDESPRSLATGGDKGGDASRQEESDGEFREEVDETSDFPPGFDDDGAPMEEEDRHGGLGGASGSREAGASASSGKNGASGDGQGFAQATRPGLDGSDKAMGSRDNAFTSGSSPYAMDANEGVNVGKGAGSEGSAANPDDNAATRVYTPEEEARIYQGTGIDPSRANDRRKDSDIRKELKETREDNERQLSTHRELLASERELVLIDCGNSQVKWCWVLGDEFLGKFRSGYTDLSDLRRFVRKMSRIKLYVGTQVCGEAKKKLVEKAVGGDIIWLASERTALGIRNHYRYVEEHGSDRWFNVLGARHFTANDCVVVSCGTAITCDVLTKSNAYLGGSISPGFNLMRKSLSMNTARLKRNPGKYYDFPTTTPNALATGIMNAACGAVQIMRHKLRKRSGGNPVDVILTGGGAWRVLEHLELDPRDPGEVKLVDNLIFYGLLKRIERL